jgi:hypothetical protein
MSKSIRKNARGKVEKTEKPAKPRDDFPLFPHARGYWAKKVKGIGSILRGKCRWRAAVGQISRIGALPKWAIASWHSACTEHGLGWGYGGASEPPFRTK